MFDVPRFLRYAVIEIFILALFSFNCFSLDISDNEFNLNFASRDFNLDVASNSVSVGNSYYEEDVDETYLNYLPFIEDGSQIVHENAGTAVTEFDSLFEVAEFVDEIENIETLELPVGIQKTMGNKVVQLVIASAIFYPDHASLNLVAKIEWKSKKNPGENKILRLGALGIRYNYHTSFDQNVRMVLLNNVKLPIKEDEVYFTLNGNFDPDSPDITDYTKSSYIEMSCGGLKSLTGHFIGSVSFDSKNYKKVIKTGDEFEVLKDDSLQIAFDTYCSLDDFYIELSTGMFTYKETDVIFDIQDLVLDLSSELSPVNLPTDSLGKGIDKQVWEGLFVSQFTTYLPEEFGKKNGNKKKRLTVDATNLFIDDNGLTVGIEVGNIMPDVEDGDIGGWPISVTSAGIRISKNEIHDISIGGDIVLPVAKDKDGAIGYMAKYENNEGSPLYLFTASDDSTDIDCGFWVADMKITAASITVVKAEDNPLIVSASINGNIKLKGDKLSGMELSYEKLCVSNTPEMTIGRLSYPNSNSNNGITLAGLNVGIQSGDSITYDGVNKKLSIPLEVSIVERNSSESTSDNTTADKSATVEVQIFVKNQKIGERQSWAYDHTSVGTVSLKAYFKKFSMNGELTIFNEEDNKGFSGEVAMKINASAESSDDAGGGEGSMELKAKATFGRCTPQEGAAYSYFNVGILASGLNVPIAGPVTLNGIGGAVAYNMKKDTKDNGTANIGYNANFKEDSSAGLYLGCNTIITISSGAPVEAAFEIQFNQNWGVSYFTFAAKIDLAPPDIIPNVKSMMANYNKIADKMGNITGDGKYDPYKAPDNTKKESSNFVRIQFYIKADFENKALVGKSDVFVRIADNMIIGEYEKNRAGSVYLFFNKETQYIHAGYQHYDVTNASDGAFAEMKIFEPLALGLNVTGGGSASIEAGAKAYFLLGDEIPELPHPDVMLDGNFPEILRKKYDELNGDGMGKDISGSGLAFGSAFNFNADLTFGIFYANFGAYVGFDVLLKRYENCLCSNLNQTTFGVNNWYAQGQAYAGFDATLGMAVKVWGIRKRVEFLHGELGALLMAKLPNPTWFAGTVYARYSVLKGAVKGNCEFSFEFGETCDISVTRPEYEPPEIDFIESLSIGDSKPDDPAQISPFTEPYFTFNYPLNKDIYFSSQDSIDGRSYRLICSNQTGKKLRTSEGDSTISINVSYVDETKARFYPDKDEHHVWDENSRYQLNMLFVLQQKNSDGKYITVIDSSDNQVRLDTAIYFATTESPNTLSNSMIADCYPIPGQQYFMKGTEESISGFLDLNLGKYRSLFEGVDNSDVSVKIAEVGGDEPFTISVENSTDLEDGKIRFIIPTDYMSNSTDYTLTLVNKSNDIDLLSYDFRTSSYNTFEEKLSHVNSLISTRSSVSEDIQFTFEYEEPFGEVELFGSRYNGGSPLVNVKLVGLDDEILDNELNLSIPRSWGDVNNEMRFNSIFPYEFAGLSSVMNTIGENYLYDNYEFEFKLGFVYRNVLQAIEKPAKYSYIEI